MNVNKNLLLLDCWLKSNPGAAWLISHSPWAWIMKVIFLVFDWGKCPLQQRLSQSLDFPHTLLTSRVQSQQQKYEAEHLTRNPSSSIKSDESDSIKICQLSNLIRFPFLIIDKCEVKKNRQEKMRLAKHRMCSQSWSLYPGTRKSTRGYRQSFS